MKEKGLTDILHLTLFPRRYKAPNESAEYWHDLTRKQANMAKKLRCSDRHWRVITFVDGHKELAYLTGKGGYVYRGLLLRRRLEFWAVRNIRLAF